MSFSIREASYPQDGEAVARIMTWWDEFTVAAADVVGNAASYPKDQPIKRLVAEVGGEVVGYGRCMLNAPNPRNAMLLDAAVLPDHQRMGIGSSLIKELEVFAKEKGASCVVGAVTEHRKDSADMVKRRGYEFKTLFFQSEIDPQGFDPNAFAQIVVQVGESGYHVKTLSELPQTEETDRAYYQATHDSDTDTPWIEYYGVHNYEKFKKVLLGAPWFDRRGAFLAMKDGQIVGVSNVNKGSKEFNGEMFIEFTGVVPDHRGKGLATAMKVRALQYAKEIGGTKVRTGNNTSNAPMRAVNKKLGFIEQPGWLMMVKEL